MAFEKTQEQLDTLRNLTWQNGKLIEQNQQLLDQLENGAGAIGSEIMVGKQSLVDAIEYKGGVSNAEKSLQGIAEDIRDIPNFDQWARLAGVLAGGPATDSLSGHNQNVNAGSITEITDPFGLITDVRDGIFNFWDLLKSIELPQLSSLRQICRFANSLEKIKFINVKLAEYECISYLPKLKEIILPSCEVVGNFSFRECPELFNIVLGKLTSPGNFAVMASRGLKNITIGVDTDVDLPFAFWNPTNVIAEGQSGIDELNSNLYNNLLTKLYDHSTDGITRTLRLGWLANVSQENIDYANSKGWTLTT